MSGPVLRPAQSRDRGAIIDLFRSTACLGAPHPFPLRAQPEYDRLSLGWFLGRELDSAAVLERDGEVVGYALVATDLEGLAVHQRGEVVRVARALLRDGFTGRLDRRSARFWALRALDAVALRRRAGSEPAPVVAHLNLAPGERAGLAGRRLVAHIDGMCARAGHDAWYGEINAPTGRRAPALVRYGADIVAWEPNRTLTWLVAEPVERIVMRRRIGTGVPLAGVDQDRSPSTARPSPHVGALDPA